VLGIDVGFSSTRRSGAICRLEWDESGWRREIRRFRYLPEDRRAAIREVAGDHEILVAAFDGPFRADLAEIGVYRTVERVLTRGIARLIGKPGASNAPIGRKLNRATSEAVADVLELTRLHVGDYDATLHRFAVVEAFPNSFMGVMLPDETHRLNKGRGGKSDRYYLELCRSGGLQELVSDLLPQRKASAPLEAVTDHDDRAALVCAMSALSVAARAYVAVGDDHGRIVLPPRHVWNPAVFDLVAANCAAERDGATMIVESR
jgi:hypothetical protein